MNASTTESKGRGTSKSKKVFLGMPVYGGYHPLFVRSLMHLLAAQPCRDMIVHACIGDSLVARARNRIAAKFLASDATHLLMLDTDLIFSPEQIVRLASHNVPIVAGLYPKKQPQLDWVCNRMAGETTNEQGLQRVRYAGTGCLMIAREVLERMRDLHPELAYEPDDGDEPGTKWDFFSTGVWRDPATGKGRYLSEDWFFCQRALELGEDIWMDMEVVMKHVGDCVYPIAEVPWEEGAVIDTQEN